MQAGTRDPRAGPRVASRPMSTRLCLFGVDPQVEDKAIIGAARAFFEGLRARPQHAFVGIQGKAKAKKRRWFYLLVEEEWDWTFEGVASGLAKQFKEMSAILYHDGWGV